MITLDKALRHMAWSNQNIIKEISKFPDDIYALRAAIGEWPIGKILNHLVSAAEWYRFLLTDIKWTELPRISTSQMLLEVAPYLAELDKTLIEAASQSDAEIAFTNDEGGLELTTRSMVLTQAVTHTAEHKGQLATILRVNDFHLDLDKFDLWNFE